MSPFEAIGKYYDGQVSAAHEVMIGITKTGIRIASPDGRVQKEWSYPDIRVLDEAEAPQPARLMSLADPEARLYINPDNGWLRLKDHLPQQSFQKVSLPASWPSLIGYTGFAAAILIFLFFGLGDILEYGAYLIPETAEEQLGQYVFDEIAREDLCVGKQGGEALHKMAEQLQNGAERTVNYRIKVLQNDSIVNALALPGGTLVLFSGLLKDAQSAEELSGVLAHEMAHLELYHPTKSLVRVTGLSMLVHMMFGGDGLAGNAANMANTLTMLSYNREDERAADEKAQDLLLAAGLNPQNMTLFFKRLEQSEQSPEPFGTYLSTHPAVSARIKHMQGRHNEKNPAYRKILTAREWQDIRGICAATQKL